MGGVSPEFGQIIKDILAKNHLTFRRAGLISGISAAYWKDMSDGRIPSKDIIARIAESFDDADEDELRVAAGYSPKLSQNDPVKAVEFALRGQKNISEVGKQQILDFVRRVENSNKKD